MCKQLQYVCINASQVAMCINANRYKPVSEALEIMWKRVAPTGYAAAMHRNGLKTEEERAAEISETHDEVRHLMNLSLASACESSDQVATKYDAVARQLSAVSLPDEERRLVDDVLKRNLYTSYGNEHEHDVLQYIRQRLGIQCQEDSKVYKEQMGVCHGPWGAFPWSVAGKIDAIDVQRTLLIEIKNRVNKLRAVRRDGTVCVPFYEYVQVQAYLRLLGLKRAILVECLTTKNVGERLLEETTTGVESFVNVVHIDWHPEQWDHDILPKLAGFVHFLASIVHDVQLQDKYLNSKRRSALILTHVRAHMRAHAKSGLRAASAWQTGATARADPPPPGCTPGEGTHQACASTQDEPEPPHSCSAGAQTRDCRA
jgi:hypothetical protein